MMDGITWFRCLPLLFLLGLTCATSKKEELLAELQSSITDKNKLASVVNTVNEYDTEKNKLKEAKKSDTDAVSALKEINASFYTGLSEIITGIRNKDARTFFIGSFKLASTLVATHGGIYGLIASKVLLLMSQVLGIYGDLTKTKWDPMKAALENFQISNLELDIAGAKEYFDNFINPVVVTNFDVKAEKPAQSITATVTDPDALPFTSIAAEQIIKNAQKNLELYGKLQFLINKYCKNGGDDEAGKTAMKQCMSSIGLYVKLSEAHSAFLETSMYRIHISESIKNEKEKKEYIDTIIGFLAKRQQRDNATLHFLTDPMQYPDKTDVMFELYSKQDEYEDIVEHLLALKPNGVAIYHKDRAVICREEKLKGLCRMILIPEKRLLYEKKYSEYSALPLKTPMKVYTYDKVDLPDWPHTRSIFIPPGVVVYLGDKSNHQDAVGGLYGLAVYSSNEKLDRNPIYVQPNTYHQRKDYVQICTKKNDNVARWCDTIEFGGPNLKFSNFKGVDLSKSTLDSIKVPNDYNVIIKADKTYLAIVGPFTAKELGVCGADKWKSIEVVKIKDEKKSNTANTKAEEKKPKILQSTPEGNIEINFQKEDLTIDELSKVQRGDKLVQVCSEENLKGLCKQLFGKVYVQSKKIVDRFKDLVSGSNPGCKFNIKSVKIPGGKKVTFEETYSDATAKSGPYVGPVAINKLHDRATYKFIIEDTNEAKVVEDINLLATAGTEESPIS